MGNLGKLIDDLENKILEKVRKTRLYKSYKTGIVGTLLDIFVITYFILGWIYFIILING